MFIICALFRCRVSPGNADRRHGRNSEATRDQARARRPIRTAERHCADGGWRTSYVQHAERSPRHHPRRQRPLIRPCTRSVLRGAGSWRCHSPAALQQRQAAPGQPCAYARVPHCHHVQEEEERLHEEEQRKLKLAREGRVRPATHQRRRQRSVGGGIRERRRQVVQQQRQRHHGRIHGRRRVLGHDPPEWQVRARVQEVRQVRRTTDGVRALRDGRVERVLRPGARVCHRRDGEQDGAGVRHASRGAVRVRGAGRAGARRVLRRRGEGARHGAQPRAAG